MKNLAKGLMSLVVVMLISVSAFAQLNGDNKLGSVTLEVESYLVFTLDNEALEFTYNALTPELLVPKATTVMVQSNINWIASVAKTADVLPAGITLMCESAPMPAVGSTVDKSGIKTQNVTFTYDFEVTGNPGPATYITPLTYSIAADL